MFSLSFNSLGSFLERKCNTPMQVCDIFGACFEDIFYKFEEGLFHSWVTNNLYLKWMLNFIKGFFLNHLFL